MTEKDPLQALKKAVELSPENVPFLQHFAEMLLSLGRVEQAETEYRRALEQAPRSTDLKFGLARAFYHQGKDS